jgi:DNA-binding PadR family transcriptional regulator
MAESISVTEPVLLILLSLAEQPRHGYGIMKDVAEMSDGRVRLSTGTLYGALRRMLEDGWITRHGSDDTSRGRQDYRLTTRGRKVVEQEVYRVKQLARIAGMRLAATEQ